MPLRVLFNIILKVLGIFFIKDFLVTIPQLLTVIYYLTTPGGITQAIWTFLSTLLVLAVYGIVAGCLLFKTEAIIDTLKLDVGMEPGQLIFAVHRSTVLSIAVIVTGALILIEAVPDFCRQLYDYFREQRLTYGQINPKIAYTIYAGIKIAIGIFFMAEQKRVVNFIERQRKK